MTAKKACRPIRRVRFLADRGHLAGTSRVAWPRAVISVLTHGSGGPRIALVHERKSLTAANAVGPAVANCDSMPAKPAGPDVQCGRSTSGRNPAPTGASPAVMPVAAEMLVVIVALVE